MKQKQKQHVNINNVINMCEKQRRRGRRKKRKIAYNDPFRSPYQSNFMDVRLARLESAQRDIYEKSGELARMPQYYQMKRDEALRSNPTEHKPLTVRDIENTIYRLSHTPIEGGGGELKVARKNLSALLGKGLPSRIPTHRTSPEQRRPLPVAQVRVATPAGGGLGSPLRLDVFGNITQVRNPLRDIMY